MNRGRRGECVGDRWAGREDWSDETQCGARRERLEQSKTVDERGERGAPSLDRCDRCWVPVLRSRRIGECDMHPSEHVLESSTISMHFGGTTLV